MAVLLSERGAWGGPGIEPRWTRSDKDGVATAYSTSSLVWFTVSKGILNEVYYPTIDQPQTRDLQYLITDGETFFRDERHLVNTHEVLDPYALGYRVTNADPEHGYRIIKEIISAPHHDCVLIHTKLEVDPGRATPKLYALLAPHLGVGGRHNNGNVAVATNWGKVLTANKGGVWAVMVATSPFLRCSCGYIGTTDGWQDLSRNRRMDFEFDSAVDGNISLMGEIDLSKSTEFVLALAFGKSLHQALTSASQALAVPFQAHRERFVMQWRRAADHLMARNEACVFDDGRLYRTSHALILAHEGKLFDGAVIASLSIPWGSSVGDDNLGGYHLVWTRDMYQAATGLLAAGHTEVPLRALIYLACTQRDDGGFYQNFWIDGEPYWRGVQLDETAFPILLARHLHRAGALQDFDPLPMVLKAAEYLLTNGPATMQERWEENAGYSPSTLAAHIAALVCAGAFARERGETAIARYLEACADFLEAHLEAWTVTTEGSLLPGVPRHYIRIQPVDPDEPDPDEDPNKGLLLIKNQPPGEVAMRPAKDIVDAGFLELVRYGIRRADDPIIVDSLRVIDAVLKVETPKGPSWRRYNHDGYGQRADGGPFMGWGKGHAWPLLTGERGHYELAAGRDARPLLRTMERFASSLGLLPEQVWADPDLPRRRLCFGGPTRGPMPLVWAHAEYLKLCRSITDGQVFDLVPEVAARYGDPTVNRRASPPLEIWKFNRQPRRVAAGGTLRIQSKVPFRLRWTLDEWATSRDDASHPTGLGPEYVDLTIPDDQQAPARFTFFWTQSGTWEGRDFQVAVVVPQG